MLVRYQVSRGGRYPVLLFLALLCLMLVPVPGQEWSWSAEQRFSLGMYPDWTALGDTDIEAQAGVLFTAGIQSDSWDLATRIGARLDHQGQLVFLVDSLVIGLQPVMVPLRLELGRFEDRLGFAAAFPLADPQLGSDPLRLVTGMSDEVVLGADMIRLRLALGNIRIRTAVVLPPREAGVVDPASVWFPLAAVPATFELLNFRYDLRQVVPGISEFPPWTPENLGFMADLSLSLGMVDCFLLAYHGWNRSTVLIPHLKLDAPYFDILLDVHHSRKTVVAAGAETLVGDGRIWLEAGYEIGSAYRIPGSLAVLDESVIAVADAFRYTVGLSWYLPVLRAQVFAELADSIITAPAGSPAISLPPLMTGLVCGMSLSLLDGRLESAILGLASPLRSSGSLPAMPGYAAVITLRISPDLEKDFFIALPFFWGGNPAVPEEIPGAYAGISYFTVSFKQRF